MSNLAFDENLVEQLEAMYRTRDVLRRRRLVQEALGAQPGERVLDVGCGPGFYVAELLEAVGPQGAVTGLDLSEAMLAVAARRCEGHENVRFAQADATSLPVADAEFDAALSVQVIEYVTDVEAALAELRRVLKPGGRLVLWDVDWGTLSIHSPDPAQNERVLRAWDDHLVDPVLPRTLAPRLRAAGFEDVRMEGHSFATAELTPEAYGGSLIPLIEDFVAAKGGEAGRDAREWGARQRELGERGEFYFACTQFCFSARRPA